MFSSRGAEGYRNGDKSLARRLLKKLKNS